MRGTGCLWSKGDEEAEEEVGGDRFERFVQLLGIIVGVVGFGDAVPGTGEWEDPR